jgi:hypothetical protein
MILPPYKVWRATFKTYFRNVSGCFHPLHLKTGNGLVSGIVHLRS